MGERTMKIVASIEVIQAEMQRRIQTSGWAGGYCASCLAPHPNRIQPDGVANWIADVAATAKPGCEGFLLEVVASVRKQYDLPAQPFSEAIRDLLRGRKPPFCA